MSETLLCYLWMYVGLGAVFFVGLGYAWKQGDVGLQDTRRRNLFTLVGGYALYAVIHGFFQFVAPGL